MEPEKCEDCGEYLIKYTVYEIRESDIEPVDHSMLYDCPVRLEWWCPECCVTTRTKSLI